ncbi:MAG: class I mannose-6-phosphate isomerase [Actinomycetota bacterium]
MSSERVSNYDKHPTIFGGSRTECLTGWDAIASHLRGTGSKTIIIETYPGVAERDIAKLCAGVGFSRTFSSTDAFKDSHSIDQMVHPDVTDDPVFGKLTHLQLEDFFDPSLFEKMRREIVETHGPSIVFGPGASLLADKGILVFADMPRWESQLRMRRGEFLNLGAADSIELWQLRYKRAYFVDWRVADRLRKKLWSRIDFVLDTTQADEPKMIASSVMYKALERASGRPFRVVPYFDPAPWGGQWMKEVCDLDPREENYGWCFDCVPEENSLLLDFQGVNFEIPSVNLIFRHPKDVLGTSVYGRFGDEFPIRFDFLDTIQGGNLSLQVHPLTEYIQDKFGMHYTQDESYYILDAEPQGEVLLGLKKGIDRSEMLSELRKAELGDYRFPDERFINRFPARKHDHFLIPAGTLHCSTRCMVLEISATPYIFTFKLWDWDRPGLDGRPRPVHIDHGEKVIRWERDTDYARAHLINRVQEIDRGEGWMQERTGLHEAEFIETRRHWFTGSAPHEYRDGVCVFNLVEGEEAIVESQDGAFDPFIVHYAETFIVPAAAGAYTIRPHGASIEKRCATIKAFVRDQA